MSERGAATASGARVLFVYGTLLRGESNHPLLDGARLLGAARSAPAYDLYDLGAYPALVAGGATAIAGELWAVDATTLAAIDQLEGHPIFFRRQPVAVDGHDGVEAYFLTCQQVAGRPRLAAGSWRVARGASPGGTPEGG